MKRLKTFETFTNENKDKNEKKETQTKELKDELKKEKSKNSQMKSSLNSIYTQVDKFKEESTES